MTTGPKLIANRRNAKASSGPVSAAGKAASSQNARKHGLRSSAPSDRDEAAIAAVMAALMGDSPERRPEARAAAEARLYLDRVKSAKAMVLGAAMAHAGEGAPSDGTGSGPVLEASAVLSCLKQQLVLDDYERRAASCYRNALRAFWAEKPASKTAAADAFWPNEPT